MHTSRNLQRNSSFCRPEIQSLTLIKLFSLSIRVHFSRAKQKQLCLSHNCPCLRNHYILCRSIDLTRLYLASITANTHKNSKPSHVCKQLFPPHSLLYYYNTVQIAICQYPLINSKLFFIRFMSVVVTFPRNLRSLTTSTHLISSNFATESLSKKPYTDFFNK